VQLKLDTQLRLADDAECRLRDVVVDPDRKTVTHLVVYPVHREHQSRLVPIADIASEADGVLRLSCDRADFDHYPYVESTSFVGIDEPITVEDGWEIGIERVLTLPGFSSELPESGLPLDSLVEVAYDMIPEHTVEIRRESVVHLADGDRAGHVEGFVVDGKGSVTHVVLRRGHLWGKRDIAIPIGAIKRIGLDEVLLRLTKDEVDALPHVPASGRDDG
jgi:sporulation protein YlmC with PRC-barrel domain